MKNYKKKVVYILIILSIIIISLFCYVIFSIINNTSEGIEKQNEEDAFFKSSEIYNQNITNLFIEGKLINGNLKDNIEYFESYHEEEYFIYFGRNNCQYCQEFLPILSDYLLNFNEKQVFYYDTNKNLEIKEEIINMFQLEFVPTLIKINGNSKIKYNDEKDDLKDFFGNEE
ncbi:hypothetical protein [Enterococcus sp. RIT-PI-f]|uniref:hypothetical protein n=1 Tax=Enterococcus sp. RIT-PI-f TaxID=1690244 RepID=UPI0006B95B37|nr:hypothetical protein [Enterococcus sp. RIT-PI-f]KPG70132.1 hypothetical protein AEQ18_09520 [Enterococcus sp. RIT-PI-f]